MDRAGPFDGDWSGERHTEADGLCAELRRLIGQINALQAEAAVLAAKAAEAIGATGDLGFGFRSVEHRLAHELHLSTLEAKRYLTVGKALPERPALAEACTGGEFGLNAADVMARSSDPHTEASLVEHARNLSIAQLQRTCAVKRNLDKPVPEPDAPVEEHLRLRKDPDTNSYMLDGRLDATNGEALAQQLAQRREELAGGDRDPEAPYPSNVEALLDILRSGTSEVRDRYAGLLNIDLADFERHVEARRDAGGEPAAGPTGITTAGGLRVSDAEIDRIFDAGLRLRWVLRRRGEPLWVSHQSRLPPDWMRQLLRADQPECVVDGCNRSAGLHAHHLVHWEQLPETRYGGLALLCGPHHRLLHSHDDLRLRAHPTLRGVFVLVDLDGEPVLSQHQLCRPPDARAPDVAGPAPPCGEPLDDYALDMILDRLLRPPPDEKLE